MTPPITDCDHLIIYCRKLGHELAFSYCRKTSADHPCEKILDCWHEQIDIVTFVNEHFSEQVRATLTTPATPKISTLIELIERAKARSR